MTTETWRKSSRSNVESACVELSIRPTHAGIRDTKNRTGGTLTFPPTTLHTFLACLKT